MYVITGSQEGKFVNREVHSMAEAIAMVRQLRKEGFEVRVTLDGKPVTIE
jgi:hypothetical protein